ncbi:hypothetical protein MMC30_000923 [Trapelia coarctata]|nr:hypothetical protein [Trapelia coarctata]
MTRTGMPKKIPETTMRRPRDSSIQVVVGMCGSVDESFGAVCDDGAWSSEEDCGGSFAVEDVFECREADEAGPDGMREDASEPDARVESREPGDVILKNVQAQRYDGIAAQILRKDIFLLLQR